MSSGNNHPLIIIRTCDVSENNLPKLEQAMEDLAGLAEAAEPDMIAYRVFFSRDGSRMTVIQVHPDDASAAFHPEVVAPRLSGFSGMIRMSGIDVFGEPGHGLLEKLRLTVQMPGEGGVAVHRFQTGFARFPGHAPGENGRGFTARAVVPIHAPAGRVWDALTDPAAIHRYFLGTTVTSDWREGSRITWSGTWEGKPYEDRGAILRFEPGKILQLSHYSPLSGLPDVPEHYHTVTIRLVEAGGETSVILTQDNNATEIAMRHSQENWEKILAGLKTVVEDDPVLKMFSEYEKAFAALDIGKNAALFADTFISAGPRGVIAQNRQEFIRLAGRAAEFYRGIGQSSARILSLQETIISREYSLFCVHWGVTFRKTGDLVIEFDVSYLVQTRPEPEILLFVAHEDEEKAMEDLGIVPAGGSAATGEKGKT